MCAVDIPECFMIGNLAYVFTWLMTDTGTESWAVASQMPLQLGKHDSTAFCTDFPVEPSLPDSVAQAGLSIPSTETMGMNY